MVPSELDAAIQADISEGHTPIAVIASAGTVNTGAIDPLDEVADVCGRHGVWLHIDGAYGGPAILSRSYAKQLSALSRADSLALDPHKWLYVPVEAGLVLVRDRPRCEALSAWYRRICGQTPRQKASADCRGSVGPGYQQTRGFRALKVWMALRHHGLNGYRTSIERDIDWAEQLGDSLRSAPRFRGVRASKSEHRVFPVCIASRGIPQQAEAIDALNKRVLEHVQLGGRAFLSSTVIDGRFWLRACIVNPRARESDVLSVVDIVREAARRGGG